MRLDAFVFDVVARVFVEGGRYSAEHDSREVERADVGELRGRDVVELGVVHVEGEIVGVLVEGDDLLLRVGVHWAEEGPLDQFVSPVDVAREHDLHGQQHRVLHVQRSHLVARRQRCGPETKSI